ncbi:MAG: VOC family protein [Acidobacteriota bacterium]
MGAPVLHFDIGCRDREKVGAFYRDLLGWTLSPANDLSSEVDTGSGEGINGAITSLGHEPHNYVMIYATVEDVEASMEQVKELGGQVDLGPVPVPGRGRFAWCKDPDGNLFGLWQNES